MGFLSVSLTFVGYVLVYAAVAKGGRFATAPWAGVYLDAYDDAEQAQAKPQDAPSVPTPRPRGSAQNPPAPLQGMH